MEKTGVVQEISSPPAYQQTVMCDDGQVMFFCGVNRIKDAKVGDRVTMTYHSGKSFGLWFGKVTT